MATGKYKVIGYVVEYWSDSDYIGYVEVMDIDYNDGSIIWKPTGNINHALIPTAKEAYDVMNELYLGTRHPLQIFVFPVIENVEIACGIQTRAHIASVYRKKEI